MRISWGWVVAGLLGLALVLTWRGCGVTPIDRVRASELEAERAAFEARGDSLADALVSIEALESDLASRAEADAEIEAANARADSAQGRADDALAEARRLRNVASDTAAVYAAYEATIAEKDEQVREKDEALRISNAERFRLAARVDSLVPALAFWRDTVAVSLRTERDFLKSEAERLEAVPRFHVNTPGVLVPVALGLGLLGGLALGG